MQVELGKASSLAQSGRFAEAAQLYRALLARVPDHPEATHFLGVCLVRSGSRDEGLALLGRSVELAPQNSAYRLNLGLMLAEAGALEAAEQTFEALVRLEAKNATGHNYLGMARQRRGKFDQAIAAYQEALRLRPGDAGAANNLGYCLLERGEVEAALHWLRRALAADANNPMAHLNLGNALRTGCDLESALECYERARALSPALGHAHYNLALTLRDLGRNDDALAATREALRGAPGHGAAWQLFAELLAVRRFSAWDEVLAAECERLFSQTEVEVQACAEAVLSLVRCGPRGRLFVLLIEHALIADEHFERELASLRRELLFAPGRLELTCAVAQQCFLNEYLWPEGTDETEALARVDTHSALGLARRAMYRPLQGHAKPQDGSQAFERLWRRLVDEPAQEGAIAVPALTAVEDPVSRKVQAQYEEHPYPRWHRAPIAGTFPLPQLLRSLFPGTAAAKLAAPAAPQVLIAGCGTGRHAAITAQLQPLGRVLAVDISRASLAYAMRRSGELGLTNVRFAQADILALGTLEERFDLIECSGVLHHMADPLAGWRVLATLLRPGGFMKLGLYSELARRHIVAARELVQGLDVREARRRILALDPGHPARKVSALRDFYAASGVRDLVLHAQEHRFTIPQLASAIEQLGLEFLGFELPGSALSMSLEEWDAYETAHPDTFASMYQFWIRRAR